MARHVLEIGRHHIIAYTQEEIQAILAKIEKIEFDANDMKVIDKLTFAETDKLVNGDPN